MFLSMFKKFLIFLFFVSIFILGGCQKSVDSIQRVALSVPPDIETVMRVGTQRNIAKITFQKGKMNVVWQNVWSDPKVPGPVKMIYAPFVLTRELDLSDGTKIWASGTQGYIAMSGKKMISLEEGQSYDIERDEILGLSQEIEKK